MDTRAMQKRLLAHGFPVDIDGRIGPQTREALTKFQKLSKLPATGVPGPETFAALAAPVKIGGTIPKYMQVALSYLGTKEAPGSANNPLVVDMFKLAEHPQITADSVPWCAAFIAACLKKAGTPNEVARSLRLWAAAYAQIGSPLPIQKPVWGSIGVKTRHGGGHVGFVVAANKDRIWLLGGNQGDKVSIASFPREAFTAFRLPTGIDAKTLPPLPTSAAGASSPTEA